MQIRTDILCHRFAVTHAISGATQRLELLFHILQNDPLLFLGLVVAHGLLCLKCGCLVVLAIAGIVFGVLRNWNLLVAAKVLLTVFDLYSFHLVLLLILQSLLSILILAVL